MAKQHVSLHDVRGMAEYARIGMADAELADMTDDLNAIIESLAPITEIGLDGVEPTFHPIGGIANVVREDVETAGFTQAESLANAPKAQDGAFLIPSILGAASGEGGEQAAQGGGQAGSDAGVSAGEVADGEGAAADAAGASDAAGSPAVVDAGAVPVRDASANADAPGEVAIVGGGAAADGAGAEAAVGGNGGGAAYAVARRVCATRGVPYGADGADADGLTALGVNEIRRGLAAKEFSARELTDAAFAQIAAEDEAVHAYLELTADAAYAAADGVDAAIARGEAVELPPLAGVPVAFKDNMNLRGTHTTCSSRMLERYVSPYTATCVERVLSAGAIPLGKLNMDEFAFGSSTETSAFGPTRNPWDIARVPGGSSGGSAAAVAAGMACLTLGSDTGGSIRQPASFCGVVGVKPTYGVVSRYGVVAFGSSLDQVGPFARSVEDAALCLNALAAGGRDLRDCTSQDVGTDFTARLAEGVRGMRIGLVPAFMEARGLEPEVKARIEEAARALQGAGAELVEVELPHAQAAMSAYYVLGPCEAFSNLARFDSVRYGHCEPGHADLGGQYEASRAAGFGAEARRRILLGAYLLGAGVYDRYYYPAQQVRTLITQDYAAAFERVDCILAPTSPRTAFRFGEVSDPVSMHLADMFTISINIAGNGGMSVPVGLGAETGLPVGAQLIAPAFRDENMFRAAAALEQVWGKAPVVQAGATGTGAAAQAGAAQAAHATASVSEGGAR